jgi:hypothetical protein
MSGASYRDPWGPFAQRPWQELGILPHTASRRPGPSGMDLGDRRAFESAVQAMEAQLANAGSHLVVEGRVRQLYADEIRAMAQKLMRKAETGWITWSEAARQANETRNAVMDVMRDRSTPVGRAWAETLKREGKSLNEMIGNKTIKLFGPQANFNQLARSQKEQVYKAVVQSAGTAREEIVLLMRRLSQAGRGLVALSLALSVYEVATAEDPWSAARRETAVTGAGIAGGIAGGAIAGLACGPGAPVCVTAGAFVGGVLAAFGVDLFW